MDKINLRSRFEEWVSEISGLINPAYVYLFANIIIATSLCFAAYMGSYWLYLSVLGLGISCLGYGLENYSDAEDEGNELRGFLMSFVSNGLGTSMVILGFMIYVGSPVFVLGFVLSILYLWRLVMLVLRYRIDDEYFRSNKSLRHIHIYTPIVLMIMAEIFVPSSIVYSSVFIISALLVINVFDLRKLFVVAGERDSENYRYGRAEHAYKIISSFFKVKK